MKIVNKLLRKIPNKIKSKKVIAIFGIFCFALLGLIFITSYGFYNDTKNNKVFGGTASIFPTDFYLKIYLQNFANGSPASGYTQVSFIPTENYEISSISCNNNITSTGSNPEISFNNTDKTFVVNTNKRGTCKAYFNLTQAAINQGLVSDIDNMINVFVQVNDSEVESEKQFTQVGIIPSSQYKVNVSKSTCLNSAFNKATKTVEATISNSLTSCNVFLDKSLSYPVTVSSNATIAALVTDSVGQDAIIDYSNLDFTKINYSNSSCNNGSTASFNSTTKKLNVSNVTEETSCNVTFAYVNNVMNFDYTGAVQTFTPILKGNYQLDVWGAQGGSYNSSYGVGGKGGYATGVVSLNTLPIIFIYVGGQGSFGSNSTSTIKEGGGFNGGGNAAYRGGSGGGATDIRIETDSLYSRVIVAGGGGGAYSYSTTYKANGGDGGGINGSSYSTTYSTWVGYGATQTAGGVAGTSSGSTYAGQAGLFGIGGNTGDKSSSASYYSNGAGGGGWYGGGAAGNYSGNSRTRAAGGGGGSNYIYTSSTASNYPAGCLLNESYYLTSANTYAGNTAFAGTSGTNETGHEGSGYARITYIP